MKDFFCKDAILAWEELELLAKALGYDQSVFYEGFNNEQKQLSHVKLDSLMLLLEGTVFYPLLNKTFNQHDGSYNIKVVSKAIALLKQRYLSFSSLRLARISFQAYEHSDNAGLQEHYILRALKLCDKTLAPLKLQQTLRHVNRLVADRLMLYEYLDLVASAENLEFISKELPQKKTVDRSLDKRNLYELCDFEDELCTYDQRCYRFLDEQFKESLKIIPVKSTSCIKEHADTMDEREWVKPPLANTAIRTEAVLKNREQSKKLYRYLNISHKMVKQCICGGSCTCMVDGVLLTSLNGDKNKVVVEAAEQGDQQKKEVKPSALRQPTYPLIVSDADIEETSQTLQNIQWDLATKKQKMRQKHQKRKEEAEKRISNDQ